jgi:hypothetical protein
MKAAFFCLLVLVTSLDDLTALSTPGPEDDIAAAENNDYLKQQPTTLAGQPADCCAFPTPAPIPCPGPASSLVQRAGTISPPPGPDALYVLMSLQR